MSEMTDLLNLSKTPAFRIVIEGKDATQTLDKRLLGMTLTDN
ncbi:phage late control D family protein, partial [Klebsiella pneumoniae]|nr:phage late control D family protein [Klebsiella pneumoniae]